MFFALAQGAPAWAGLQVPEGESEPSHVMKPSPVLSPRQVVEIQLAALKANGARGKDLGIAQTFDFASPANRAWTGPLSRFTRMIRASFSSMLDHRGARIGPLVAEGRSAVFPVVIRDAAGREHGFLWTLSRQTEGRYKDCWMTDGVQPVPVESVPKTAI